jgi:hypothetical protein
MPSPSPEEIEEVIRRLDALAEKRRAVTGPGDASAARDRAESADADPDDGHCWTCYLVGEHRCAVHGAGVNPDRYRNV